MSTDKKPNTKTVFNWLLGNGIYWAIGIMLIGVYLVIGIWLLRF